MTDRVVVAIDGPSGSGKTTVARLVAERLSYRFLDSGAMYRALALKALEEGVDGDAGEALAALLGRSEIVLRGGRVLIDGRDVSEAIRTPLVSRFVSRVAAAREVRTGMVPKQREAWPGENLVVEGRDIGSVVFPDAEVKLFLTARPEERARRRSEETGRPLAEVLEDQRERDRRDTERAHSPLVRAEGAIEIDTTGLTIEEVVEEIVRQVEEDGMMKRDPLHRLIEMLTRSLMLSFWDFRAEGVENVPEDGGALLACTHQSHLDPPMIRAPLNRHAGYVARSTLFRSRWFAAVIRYLGAVSFDREGAGAGGMREVLSHLADDDALILFPEGTRSPDGRIGPLKPGVALLVRRARVPVVPVAIEGTFACWPRHRRIFRPGRVRVVYGEPVHYGRRAGRREILSDLKERLVSLRERAISMA